MGVVRYSCAVDGYEASWIELDTRWSRPDELRIVAIKLNSEALEMLREKCKGVHLVDGDVTYDEPAELTDEGLANLDLVLWGFVTSVLFTAYREAKAITDFAMRVSPPTSEKTS
jgi:hypothetical protein